MRLQVSERHSIYEIADWKECQSEQGAREIEVVQRHDPLLTNPPARFAYCQADTLARVLQSFQAGVPVSASSI